jgi:tetratricopeptide (TPR) repeat protein
MGIKGDLKSISLANVLQDLAMNEQTGTLTIRHKDRQLALWFERGALRLVGLGPREGPSILNGLLALQKISPDEAPTVTGKRTIEGGFIRGQVKRGRLSKDDLKAALEHQMGEHLCDAFLWSEATFEFEEGEPDDRMFDVDNLDLEPRLAVDAVIVEAMRRSDEWGETRKAILSSHEILVPDPQRLPRDAEPVVRRVFALLDGERSLTDLEHLTRLGQFVLMRAAALLIRSGAARPLSASDAFERARSRAGKKEWDHALRMVRYGLDHERKNVGLLELALRCTEALENHDAAASYARQLASAQVESGQLEAAIKSYQKVLAHAPRDLTAHERLFAILLQLDLKLDALAAGEALAATYKKAGLPDKALAVYQRLIETLGANVELLESVAEIQRHLGDKQEAVKLYNKLLGQAMEKKNDTLALDYCRTILKIDPRHTEALDLRTQLESGQIERTRRRRQKLRSVVGVSFFAICVFGVAFYEHGARSLYDQIRKPLNDAKESRNYLEALRLYDTILDRYRWSVKARELRPDREDAESRYVTEEIARAEELERHGELSEAARVLVEALPSIQRTELRGNTEAKLVDLRRKRIAAENEWGAKLSGMPADEIRRVKDPLAVPALGKLLLSEKLPIRQAAVAALADLPGDSSVAALLQALADSDLSVRMTAASTLALRRKSPFRASLHPLQTSFGPGEPFGLEWRLTNLSPAEVEVTLEEAPARQLELQHDGEKMSLESKETVGKRSVRLGPGEHVGGPFAEAAREITAPGKYQCAWRALITWNGVSLTLPAQPVQVERTR